MSLIPYPGLRSFTQEESEIFFGREEHIHQLLEKLCHHRFISIIGPSGCGKSSLIRAGVIAALESEYFSKVGVSWRMTIMQPGPHPLRNLAEALLSSSILGPERSKSPIGPIQANTAFLPYLVSSLHQSSQGLVEILCETRFPKRTNILLFIDQFEEIFRYRQSGNYEEIEAFVSLLLTSTKQKELPIYVIMTMCSDYLGECVLFSDLLEIVNTGQYWVPRLTREQQRMAILGPAGVFGATVDPHLVNYLLNEMETDVEQLPLLQHCLMRMWFQAIYRTGNAEKEIKPTLSRLPTPGGITLTIEDYEAVGGLKHALCKHADEAFEELNEKQQTIATQLFRCLSEYNRSRRDLRRPALISDAAAFAGVSAAELLEVIEKFRQTKRNFITPVTGVPLDADSIIDIRYERLIRQWHRLTEWSQQEAESAKTYRRLEQAACLWKKEQTALWSIPDIDIALAWKNREQPTAEWAKRYGNHFDAAMEFLDVSEKFHHNELRRRRRQFRQKLIVLTIGGIMTIGSVTWAFKEISNAREARKIAKTSQTNYERMVSTTFGFLGESEQSERFFTWLEDTSTMESVIPTLYLMIDLSESMSAEDKEFWREKLPVLPRSFILKLFQALARERAEQALHK